MPLFAAMHALAVQRGDGLRPEWVTLLERANPALEAGRVQPGNNAARPEPKTHANVLRLTATADGESR
jgi:hypothetical protein